jgi:RNA polymerase sigma factor (TIGR02999 family)
MVGGILLDGGFAPRPWSWQRAGGAPAPGRPARRVVAMGVELTAAPPDRFADLLAAVRRKDRSALDRLFEEVYEELRVLARSVRRSFPRDSLEVAGLVHETYLKLARAKRISVEDRIHFFALVSRAMRQILIARAEEKGRLKRGGGAPKLELDPDSPAVPGPLAIEELMTLERGLERLSAHDPRQAQIVELRFLEGLTEEEIASLFGLSVRTIRREWSRAREFLETRVS